MRPSRVRPVLRAVQAELRLAAMTTLQYRASFWGEALMALVWIAWTVVPLLVVYRFRDGIAGWTAGEALLVMGFFIVLDGIMGSFVLPNLRAVVLQVRDGTFDFVLLKPLDAQVQVSVHRTSPVKLPHVFAGLVVVLVAARRLPVPPGPGDLLLSLLLLAMGTAILHSLFSMVVCTSFWFVRVDNLSYLLQSVLDAGRWPVGFYRGAARFVLTFVVPVGVMTTWPALAVRGRLDLEGVLVGLGVAVAFALASRLFWTRAIRYYSSASS